MNRQKHELEEKLTLMEMNSYSNTLGRIMLKDCLNILVDYAGLDFKKQVSRYYKLERKYK